MHILINAGEGETLAVIVGEDIPELKRLIVSNQEQWATDYPANADYDYRVRDALLKMIDEAELPSAGVHRFERKSWEEQPWEGSWMLVVTNGGLFWET